jgi:PhnB protein
MAAKVKPVPEGYSTVTPYIMVKGAAKAIDFYKRALGAEEVYRLEMPDGRIGHAELQIGSSRLMLADEMPEMPDVACRSPQALGGSTVGLCIYIADVDTHFKRAIDAGAKVRRPVQDQFYGDRNGTFEDPFGHIWTIVTHVEDVSPEEMKKRMAAMPHG